MKTKMVSAAELMVGDRIVQRFSRTAFAKYVVLELGYTQTGAVRIKATMKWMSGDYTRGSTFEIEAR